MKRIYAKIGTMPAGFYAAIRKRNPPKVGERLRLRGYDAWEDELVIVTAVHQVDGRPFYLCERM